MFQDLIVEFVVEFVHPFVEVFGVGDEEDG